MPACPVFLRIWNRQQEKENWSNTMFTTVIATILYLSDQPQKLLIYLNLQFIHMVPALLFQQSIPTVNHFHLNVVLTFLSRISFWNRLKYIPFLPIKPWQLKLNTTLTSLGIFDYYYHPVYQIDNIKMGTSPSILHPSAPGFTWSGRLMVKGIFIVIKLLSMIWSNKWYHF